MQQKLLPPRLFLICLVLMGTARFWLEDGRGWGSGTQTAAGLVILALSLALMFTGAGQFSRRKTNINTFRKPDVLVTNGVFRYTRNPMYLGFAGTLLGTAIALNSLAGLLLAGLFVLVADRWYIRFEEKTMSETFGAAYADYCAQTRRWI